MPITKNEWRTDIRLNGFSKRIVHGYQLKHFVKILVFVSTDPAFHSRCSVQRPSKINWSSCPQSTVSRISSSAVCRCRISNRYEWKEVKQEGFEIGTYLEVGNFKFYKTRTQLFGCRSSESSTDASREKTSGISPGRKSRSQIWIKAKLHVWL